MKQVFITLLAFCCTQAFAQTPFEGKVVYRIQSPKEKGEATITSYFGKQKLRMEFTEPGKGTDKEIIVVELDSGHVLTLNTELKQFKVKPLQRRVALVAAPKQIAGYAATPQQNQTMFNGTTAGLFGQSIFYVANDLFFPVPPQYKGNSELVTVFDDKVVLGADIRFTENLYGRELAATDSAEMERSRFYAEAVEVKQYHPHDSLFAVPSGYSLQAEVTYVDSTAMVDTAAMPLMDSVVLMPQKHIGKKKKAPAKKKSVSKSSALRRKEE